MEFERSTFLCCWTVVSFRSEDEASTIVVETASRREHLRFG
jgi:hypothetical protein